MAVGNRARRCAGRWAMGEHAFKHARGGLTNRVPASQDVRKHIGLQREAAGAGACKSQDTERHCTPSRGIVRDAIGFSGYSFVRCWNVLSPRSRTCQTGLGATACRHPCTTPLYTSSGPWRSCPGDPGGSVPPPRPHPDVSIPTGGVACRRGAEPSELVLKSGTEWVEDGQGHMRIPGQHRMSLGSLSRIHPAHQRPVRSSHECAPCAGNYDRTAVDGPINECSLAHESWKTRCRPTKGTLCERHSPQDRKP